ncbi:hypothetical protein [Aeoliella sp.]|uniref:hypothetical protein n=1 Tax=Aeoliella sp. TaxID=2795800 RepID=UPI003CCBD00A
MKTFALIAVLTGVFWLAGSEANAQCGCATYYAPAYQPPVVYSPMAAYYAPPAVYAPAPVVVPTTYYTTRYRPRRAVTRVHYGYAPAYYPVW